MAGRRRRCSRSSPISRISAWWLWASTTALDEITGGSPYGATTIAGADGSRRPTQMSYRERAARAARSLRPQTSCTADSRLGSLGGGLDSAAAAKRIIEIVEHVPTPSKATVGTDAEHILRFASSMSIPMRSRMPSPRTGNGAREVGLAMALLDRLALASLHSLDHGLRDPI
jgi:hypothetical protein